MCVLTFAFYEQKGFGPLHLAAKYGNIKVARLLISRKAPVDAQGKVCAALLRRSNSSYYNSTKSIEIE